MTRAMLLRNAVRPPSVRRERGAEGLETDHRPWGSLYRPRRRRDPQGQAHRGAPGKRLSYQRHARRSEHWFIVRGAALVTLDGVVTELAAGTRWTSRSATDHRIENATDAEVVFVEVQHGEYFGEDDIVRLEDDFGRSRPVMTGRRHYRRR